MGRRTDDEVIEAVAVDVSGARDAESCGAVVSVALYPESLRGGQVAEVEVREPAGASVDQVGGAGVRAATVIERSPDDDVVETVPVKSPTLETLNPARSPAASPWMTNPPEPKAATSTTVGMATVLLVSRYFSRGSPN